VTSTSPLPSPCADDPQVTRAEAIRLPAGHFFLEEHAAAILARIAAAQGRGREDRERSTK